MESMHVLSSDVWSLIVSATRGGNILSLRYKGRDILRPASESSGDIFRFGSPILLPANRTDGGRFVFENTEYNLPITHPKLGMNMHGMVNYRTFLIESLSSTSISLVLDADESVYPFPFLLKVTYKLNGNSVKAEYQITNQGERDMPYTFGLHTTFADVATFSVPIDMSMERDERKLPTGRLLELTEREKTFKSHGENTGSISGYYLSSGHIATVNKRVRFRVSASFDRWTLFSPDGCKYLCIEPQAGSVNGLNMNYRNYKLLRAGESHQYFWTITIRR